MLPNNVVPFVSQMQLIWDMADSRHTIQIDRYTLSFGLSELDPNDPEDHIKAGAIAEKFARRIAPDHQAIIGVQDDGKGGKLHAHIFINDGRMQDGKGMDPLSYAHFHFQKIVDEVCEQHFDLQKTEAQPEKVNPSVRGARIKNEQIRAANELERQRAAAEGREVDPDKIMAERYIWQDDLRQRIKEAAAKATDEADFAHQLRLSGVELVPPKDKDKEPLRDENGNIVYLHPATKKQPAHYTYELVDTTGFPGKIPPNLKAKSHKLGTNYQPEAVKELFSTKAPTSQAEQPNKAPSVVLEMPIPFLSTPKKPAQKPTTATEKPSEDKEMEEAKKQAAYHVLTIMQQIYGWQNQPRTTGPDGKEHYVFKEWDRQLQERDAAFEQFSKWRTNRNKELKKDGLKLAALYHKDKTTGDVSVNRSELEKQFRDFLDRRDHPEKCVVVQEQPTLVLVEQHQEEQQQPAPVGLTRGQQQAEPKKPSPVEQAQQEIAESRSILYAELQRINAANERRWKEQQENDGEEDTVKLP